VDILNNLKNKFSEKLVYIKEALTTIDFSNVHPILKAPTEYAISSGGKRLRPLICILCTELFGGNHNNTRDAFLAIELIHNATLVHDDIIDDDLYRRGNPSTPIEFGIKRAVLTGDALFSMGLKYASKTQKPKIVDLLSDTALKMVQGVALQSYNRGKQISENTYFDINYLKSGSLFEVTAAIGGILASATTQDSKKLAIFGKNFGIAYQIRDDICGVYAEDQEEKLIRNDLLNGDISLPFIYALDSQKITKRDRENIISIHTGEKEEVDLKEIQRIYEETGALEKAKKKMNEFASEGKKTIDQFEETESQRSLNYLINQFFSKFEDL
jgi:geranylgeranyl pyrophosphate synthase